MIREYHTKTGKRIRLIHGDCMEWMRDCQKYDLAIVDPPYSEKFDTKASADNMARKGNYDISVLNGCMPDDIYWKSILSISENQIIWGANWYDVKFGVGGICWFKDNTGNYSPCEFAYQSFNNHIDHYEFRWNGMLQGNMKNKQHRIHPTEKPIQLYRWLLQNYAKEGDRIFDSHGGSLSHAIACYEEEFELDIIEIDDDYYKAGVKRFENHISQGVLF